MRVKNSKNFFNRRTPAEERLKIVKPLLIRLYREQGFLSSGTIDRCEYLPSFSVIRKLFDEKGKNIKPLYDFIGIEISEYQKYYINAKKYTIDDVKGAFEKEGCVLLSDTYINMESHLDYLCSCGNRSSISFHNFVNGSRCNSCKNTRHGEVTKYKKARKKPKKDYRPQKCRKIDTKKLRDKRIEIASNFCNKHNCTYTDLIESDKGFKSSLIYFICHCGNEDSKTWGAFQATPKCKNCSAIFSGESHYAWKGGISSERDLEKRTDEYRRWRQQVFERDGFTCRACEDNSGGNLRAHHILNYSEHKDLRCDVNNGITFCDSCHNPSVYGSFHNIYGTRNNNMDQVIEYIQLKKGLISDESKILSGY